MFELSLGSPANVNRKLRGIAPPCLSVVTMWPPSLSSSSSPLITLLAALLATLGGQLAAAFCPAKCRCLEAELRTYCNNTQIDLVPIMLNPALQRLDLNGNRIRNVYSSFTVYQELRHLDVSHNLITDIPRKSFIMQKSLKTLLLNNNNISAINNLSLHGLSALTLLNASHNQLSELHARIFLSLNKMETLDLSGNAIAFIHRDAFLGLLNLKALHLNANRLKQVPTHSFFYLQNLATLRLGHNLYTHLAEGAFGSLARLQELSLERCYLNTINHRAFSHLHNLTALDLHHNNLFAVPTDSLAELVSLRVLTLSFNFFVALPARSFARLAHLETLVLSSTPLNSIDPDALRDNVNLVNVILENNIKLKYLHPATFVNQHRSLRFLSLRSCQLSTLDERLVNHKVLQRLDVRDNRLECNCSLGWLVKYLGRAGHDEGNHTRWREQVKCHTPAQLRERPLITLEDTDLSCPLLTRWPPDVLLTAGLAVLAMCVIILLLALLSTKGRHKLSSGCTRLLSSEPTDGSAVVVVAHPHHMMEQTKDDCNHSSVHSSEPGHYEPVYLPNHHHRHHHHHHHLQSQHHPAAPRHPLLQYYPTIINEHKYRDNNNSGSGCSSGSSSAKALNSYHTMLTTSTRTSAISVDLCPPPSLHYAHHHIANI